MGLGGPVFVFAACALSQRTTKVSFLRSRLDSLEHWEGGDSDGRTQNRKTIQSNICIRGGQNNLRRPFLSAVIIILQNTACRWPALEDGRNMARSGWPEVISLSPPEFKGIYLLSTSSETEAEFFCCPPAKRWPEPALCCVHVHTCDGLLPAKAAAASNLIFSEPMGSLSLFFDSGHAFLQSY